MASLLLSTVYEMGFMTFLSESLTSNHNFSWTAALAEFNCAGLCIQLDHKGVYIDIEVWIENISISWSVKWGRGPVSSFSAPLAIFFYLNENVSINISSLLLSHNSEWRLKSPSTRLLVRKFFQAVSKWKNKAPHYRTFGSKFHWWMLVFIYKKTAVSNTGHDVILPFH